MPNLWCQKAEVLKKFSFESTVIQPISPELRENFAESTDELIETALMEIKSAIMEDRTISSQNKNKEIILELYHRGIFNIKDSVIKVAALLGISKNTVYMHIRNLKGKE